MAGKRFAYLGTPTEGGTVRVFECLREGLATYGWDGELVSEETVAGPGVEPGSTASVRRLLDYLAGFDLVIANVFVSTTLMNIVRYLPTGQRRIVIVHNITYATLKAAAALKDYVHHAVAVSPRIRDELVGRHGFSPDAVTTVLNAVTDDIYAVPIRERPDGRVGILSLGRLEDNSKRILSLPEMLKDIPVERYALTVAGTGPDGPELERRLAAAGIPVEMTGWISRDRLPSVFEGNEIFLFPSRFEGLGIALAEAMAAGLVPVAARIPGVTDAIIRDGVDGFIFEQRDFGTARTRVAELLDDGQMRRRMREAARGNAARLFGHESMAASYAAIFDRISRTGGRLPSLDIADWKLPRQMGPGLRGLLPAGLRRKLADALLYR